MLSDFCVIIKRNFHHCCVRVNAAGFLRLHQNKNYSQCLPLFATRKKKVKNNSKCYHPSKKNFHHSCVRVNAAGFLCHHQTKFHHSCVRVNAAGVLCHHQKEFSSLLC